MSEQQDRSRKSASDEDDRGDEATFEESAAEMTADSESREHCRRKTWRKLLEEARPRRTSITSR